MPIEIRPIPFDPADLGNAPPEVQAVQRRMTDMMRKTREERGDRFAELTQLLYAIAQLRLFLHTAPKEYAMIGNALLSQIAGQLDKLLGMTSDEIDQAGAIAQLMVDMCLIRRDDEGNEEPHRTH